MAKPRTPRATGTTRSRPLAVPSAQGPQQRLPLLAALLALSGFCALVYQMVWLREFRLLFGAATPATATVLAVFMGGLGFGSLLFGRVAERTLTPLRSYARLELAVAATALSTPAVLHLVTSIYRGSGGVVELGAGTATVLHILLSVIVLAVPCALMGGTLPLAGKTIESDADGRRGSIGLLYGLNALGGLVGVVLSTFWLLETLGTRRTLLVATAINACVAAVALWAASSEIPSPAKPVSSRVAIADEQVHAAAAPALWVYGAAFVTGFVFFLCELVWLRMSAPLLGSSTYDFGIILALALAGIGLGGVLYRVVLAPRAGASTAALFASVSAMQAFWLIAPYAYGDRLALLSFQANQLRTYGFGPLVAGWTAIGAVMVLLPSILAGVQFPLLVSLLGRGRENVGAQTGNALAWNTAGAICGSLLGGFVLIPQWSAPGCWRLATWLTLALTASAMLLALRSPAVPAPWSARLRPLRLASLYAVAALVMSVASLGPTAVWRHQPWGYGRVHDLPTTPNALRDWQHVARWQTRRDFDGREASLAVVAATDYSFYINGKSDGAAIGDAGTQIMAGLISAALHPAPHDALVVGVGTGSSAGWLADVPGMRRVDVVEIEPGILDLARNEFAPINRDVMRKPNVRTILGDAREVLSVDGPSYDLIVSEPSNPYRAGIASLYTREYYEAVRHRLNPGGIFSQWVQAYEVDAAAVHKVYATLQSVFPFVETWITEPADMLFVCHLEAPAYTLESLQQKIASPPFDEAILRTWVTDSVEGFLAHHIASPPLAKAIAGRETAINTDDNNALEYGFARSASQGSTSFSVGDLLNQAARDGLDRPTHLAAKIDPARVSEERILIMAVEMSHFAPPDDLRGEARARAAAVAAYVEGDPAAVLASWRGEAKSPMARLFLLEATAKAGLPDQARPFLEWARRDWTTEAAFAAAFVAFREQDMEEAALQLATGFERYRSDPWVRARVGEHALALASRLGAKVSPATQERLFQSVRQPFLMAANDQERLITQVQLSRTRPAAEQVLAADAWGRWYPWSRPYLEFRRDAYQAAGDPRLPLALAELAEFLRDEEAAPAPAATPATGGDQVGNAAP